MYFTPTAEISIDINPSIELGINRFDKVISATGYNEDGRELAASADVKFMDYAQAVERILSSESITKLLSQGEAVTIAVVGPNVEQRGRILSDMESCTAGQRNAYCYSADPEEVATAHGMGLSYGKYRAFLEAQALDPESTLIMLVSALAGYEHTMHAYKVAIEERYRFYSLGDAMFIHG